MVVIDGKTLVNSITSQMIGDSAVINDDYSNIIDAGNAIFNANSFDKFTGALIDKVGKMVFVNRAYSGFAPNVMKDGWEYGCVLQKVASALPEAVTNEDWTLSNGTSYDPNVFNAPTVSNKFWNKYVTFEIDRSITEEQMKSAFNSASQLNGFVAMLFNEVEKSMTVKVDGLVMGLIASMIADTLYSDYQSGTTFTGASHVKAVNLLYLYNQRFGTTLTAANCLTQPEFIRFAAREMKMYIDRLASMSELFNIGGQVRFTPKDKLHVVVHTEFESAAATYLESDTYNKELVSLPKHETVPYWQGSGTAFAFADTSKIDVKSATGNTVTASGILAVMFDNDALGVCNTRDRVDTQYNAKANFTNYFYKKFMGNFCDENENFVVFFVA